MDETKEPKDTELNPEEDVNAEEALADGSAEADGSVAPRVVRGGYVVPDLADETVRRQLSGMYQNWFLDYASYVILDRAVPHLYDGFKPLLRRVL